MIENSEIAGIILALIFVGLLSGLEIWKRFRYSKQKGFEADPLDEAVVYISYGKTKHATEILEKALLNNPERQDIAKKLNELRGQ